MDKTQLLLMFLLSGQLPSKRGVQHVVEHIFGYLDCGCPRRAELVSDVWQEMVSGERIWRALHGRNVSRTRAITHVLDYRI